MRKKKQKIKQLMKNNEKKKKEEQKEKKNEMNVKNPRKSPPYRIHSAIYRDSKNWTKSFLWFPSLKEKKEKKKKEKRKKRNLPQYRDQSGQRKVKIGQVRQVDTMITINRVFLFLRVRASHRRRRVQAKAALPFGRLAGAVFFRHH
jgi:hypothetical protein